ncbi:hypothetical protein TI39_contig452g00003 [Zymoseptoria brevis]|uniref:Uncharacterized protein n=1 Tax=Zymoseptoria brevis TaxID=1047168 RepID=A0A0F4GKL7_9PEZI|nr:hypothetical protein TI39_contig452g00003 [Zymoseptoria brevis]
MDLDKEKKEKQSLQNECERLRQKENGSPLPRTPEPTAPNPSQKKRPAPKSSAPALKKKQAKAAANRDATDDILAMIRVKPAGSATGVALEEFSENLSHSIRESIRPFAMKPYIVNGKWIEGCFVAKSYQVSPLLDRSTKNKKSGIHALFNEGKLQFSPPWAIDESIENPTYEGYVDLKAHWRGGPDAGKLEYAIYGGGIRNVTVLSWKQNIENGTDRIRTDSLVRDTG